MAQQIVSKSQAKVSENENKARGFLFSLGAIVVGIIAWLILWQLGFIASIVAFLIAWLAVKLYTFGAGGISRQSAPIVIGVIIAGIVLSFLAGIAGDALAVYLDEAKSSDWLGSLLSGDFWDFFLGNILTNGELWGAYVTDIVISIVFGALGAYSIIKPLFVTDKPMEVVAANDKPKNSSRK